MSAASAILSHTDGKMKPLPAFEAFENDLIEYLNSSDYTHEFIRDSLRQGQTLCSEMQAVVANEEVTALRKKQDALGAEILALNAKIAATDQLLQADWNALFQPLREEHRRGVEDAVAAKTAQVREEIRQGFTRWMTGDETLVAISAVTPPSF